jgi:secretory phospholipase A2
MRLVLNTIVSLLTVVYLTENSGQSAIGERECHDFCHQFTGIQGQTVLRMKHGEMFVIKTENVHNANVYIIEATDGATVIHAALQDNRLLACHLEHQKFAMEHFIRTFVGSSNFTDHFDTCLDCDQIIKNVGGTTASVTKWQKNMLSVGEFQKLKARCEGLKISRQISGPDKRTRERRAVSLIFPETRWCGVGNMSTEDQMYGNIVGIDLCCHEHDHCDYTIEGFTKKYKLFNYRFHTISHCECDDRFRSCLRATRTEAADLLGRLYFHIIGMKCFVFQRETECEERTWWGSCVRERPTNQYYAEIRGPLTY